MAEGPVRSMPAPYSHADRILSLSRQAARIERRLARLRRTADRLSWVRVAIFAAGALLVGGALLAGGVGHTTIAVLATTTAFAIAVRWHRRFDAAASAHAVWLGLLREQLARGTRDWQSLPRRPDASVPEGHPYARDLDIVGQRSLHRLIDTCASAEASELLLDWLVADRPDPVAARHRQHLVRELAPRSRFRRKLVATARLTSGTSEPWRAGKLMDWLSCHEETTARRGWIAPLAALAAANLLLAALDWRGLAGPWWRVTLPLYVATYWAAMRGAGDPFGEALEMRDALRPLATVFGLLETYGYAGTPHLRSLCRPFLQAEVRPSAHVRRVSRLLAAAGIRGNPFVWVLVNAAVPWDLFLVDRLARLKRHLAVEVPLWLDTWSELEAAAALSDLAYLNPGYAFPEIRCDPANRPAEPFLARQVGHPLLDPGTCMHNDFAFAERGEVVIVTGSNMAGKSTFVKAIGVNACLAFAGGPVDAADLSLEPMRVFASIRIADSITDGISYFYAEVKRLRGLLDALGADDAFPLLYLVDEIFRGTNNRERLLGSRALIRAMAGGNGVGLIATHDLELVALADALPKVRNAHFRDDVQDGRMTFDYRLRDGPCPTTNALRIMRLEGLPAPDA